MYQITCDNEVIYDVRIENRIVLSPVLDLEVSKNGTLDYLIPPQNELYNSIEQKKSIIKVFQIDKINGKSYATKLFRGTAYSVKTDFYNRKQVQCERRAFFF